MLQFKQLVAPATFEYVPAAHKVQLDAPDDDHAPTSQDIQVDALFAPMVLEKVPDEHIVQVADVLILKADHVPALQSEQTVLLDDVAGVD